MRILTVIILCLLLNRSTAQSTPQVRYADKIRIREAMNISAQFGDRLFNNFSKVPFAILLVTDSTEFLINHPYPSNDFKSAGRDSILNTEIFWRKTKYNPHFLATFPAVNGLSCIVAGTPETTGKSSAEWIITLLHEHFHQYQNSDPQYFAAVENLGLSGGDQTGMWMLNYTFPYDSLPVINQYKIFAAALSSAVSNLNSKSFSTYFKKYLSERQKFREVLSPEAYRYFSLQIWQEGLARYVEYDFLSLLSNYRPSPEVSQLPDYKPFNELKIKLNSDELKNLHDNRLSESKRLSFYSVGFAEGMLLNRINPNWRKKYLSDKFYIEAYYKVR